VNKRRRFKAKRRRAERQRRYRVGDVFTVSGVLQVNPLGPLDIDLARQHCAAFDWAALDSARPPRA